MENQDKIYEQSLPKIEIKPRLRNINDQLKDPLVLIYRHWAPLLITQAIIFVVTIAISLFVVALFMAPIIYGSAKNLDEDVLLSFFASGYFWAGFSIMMFVAFLVGMWGSVAMITAIGHKGEGMAPIGASLKKGLTLLLPFSVMSFLVMLAYMGGIVLFIVPAVILTIGLSLAWYIFVLENVTITEALATSWHITKEYKWSIFGRLALVMLIMWGVIFGLTMVNMVPLAGLMVVPLQFACNIVFTPYILAYFYLIYTDIRFVRKDTYQLKGSFAIWMGIFWLVGAVAIGVGVNLVIYLMNTYLVK